ncbi:dihydroorotase [Rhodobium orientis]|uniref:Amidohydrolase/deacetylase family metallohydrolase n=1 Tax=Rhodobium orientis TaxID=34017 RepID=A0A327JG72_9HYPH|nr:amidohydrolase/deacetylase family metallohydrolase [Rhodobium orientis]MBB4303850.1 dihydroorotase [Rhodobium orientis]MBK5947968.1 amidohydrolase/deacetylase family metallohydrolase [Rhodobium orientis]RAI25329.1 amidohydrolase/deacetylase family metallohydrolase [Rhodobium orientis]
MTLDLVLTGGRVIDPSQGIDRIADVGFSGGKVATIADGLASNARNVRDVSGKIVTPGIIDLHTHVYWGGTSLGIDAEEFARASAVTTCVDTGSAGPGNFPGFRKHVIEPSQTRILVYLHVSFAGIYGFDPQIMVGESHEFRLMAPGHAREVIKANRDVIVGIKVRVGRHASGPQGIAPLDVALGLSDETGLPVMCHIDEPPPSYEAVVAKLRKGDVLTHCFRPFPNTPVMGDGRVKDEVLAARERGVYFDIGHGMGSFAYKTARAMLAAGFPPDTISSDVHAFCRKGPAYDQLTTMTKFLGLGMPLGEVIARATARPAAALKRPELGTLATGAAGDASILSLQPGTHRLEDVVGEILTVDERLVAEGVVINGRWWYPQ